MNSVEFFIRFLRNHHLCSICVDKFDFIDYSIMVKSPNKILNFQNSKIMKLTFYFFTDTCTFGNIEMRIGDELNQATDYSSVCVKCICQVPPTPTCQRLPDEICDVTVHPKFDNFN